MRKRLLAILLSLALVVGIFPTMVLATGGSDTSIDLDTFIQWLKDSSSVNNGNYAVDGSEYTDADAIQDGKLVVEWSPISGCFDTREGHNCTADNQTATGNTPNRLNSGLLQFHILDDETASVSVKNVKFIYEPAEVAICANSGWAGTFTAEQAPAGQLYFMTTGDVTFENCEFDKVVLTTFNTTGTSTVTDCKFANVYNSYAIKDIRGENVSVTGTAIENCGGGIMVSQVSSETKVSSVTISNNIFKDVDVSGTASADKVGTRAIIQVASSGNYSSTDFDFGSGETANTATDCGPVIRQLNDSATANVEEQKTELEALGSTMYTSDSTSSYAAQTKDGQMYKKLSDAITAVTSSNPLTWVSSSEWDGTTPVYYNGKFYPTIDELLYDANRGVGVINSPDIKSAVIYCRPNTTIPTGTASHPSFVTNTTIFGNGATLSNFTEWDVENYYDLTKDISINIYDLNGGASVWSTRKSDFTVTVNMENCKDAHEVLFNYGSGNGRVDINVTNCTFLKSGTAHGWPISTNCLGSLFVDGCTFDGVTTGVVVNVKQPSENGTMVVTVKDSSFNNVTGQDSNKGALRVTGKEACDITLEIDDVEFTGTHADPSDITIGNMRAADNLGNVSYTITNTSGLMCVYKQDETATKVMTTLDGSSTIPYTGSNVPAPPVFNEDKTITNVTPDNLQDILDGKYGSIDGMTIELTTGNYGQIELGRATKWAGSNTEYRIGSFTADEMTLEDFVAAKNDTSVYTPSPYYVRYMSDVTLKAADGAVVSIAGIKASSGHVYGTAQKPVTDYVLDITDIKDTNKSYYLAHKFTNITFEDITFTAKSDINTSCAETVIDGFTFNNCVFDINDTASGNQAIRFYVEDTYGTFSNLKVYNCEFNECFQGIYAADAKNVSVKNCEFDTTGHNAIQIMSQHPRDFGNIVISNNTFKNIGDRIIRFGEIADGTKITIIGNTATNSGDEKNEVIKATSIADGVKTTIYRNDWGDDAKIANDQFEDTEVPGSDFSGYYISTPSKVENGKISISTRYADNGDTVTITAKPDSGYVLDILTVTDSKGNKLALTKESETKYAFTMPSSSVTITAAFSKLDHADICPSASYTDVDTNAWYHEAIDYAIENGLMNGVGGGRFDPSGNLNRAMMAQILWNLDGASAMGNSSYSDVASGAWYYDAVSWASSTGVVGGYPDGTFGPERSITRQEMTVMLYRYAQYTGCDTTASGDLTRFTDAGETASWAEAAMRWAVGSGLLSGKGDGILDPAGTATRAEVAQIFMNFCENIAK